MNSGIVSLMQYETYSYYLLSQHLLCMFILAIFTGLSHIRITQSQKHSDDNFEELYLNCGTFIKSQLNSKCIYIFITSPKSFLKHLPAVLSVTQFCSSRTLASDSQ